MIETMTFLATRHEKDGNYSQKFEAASWAEAEAVCRKKMWRLDGELVAVIPVPGGGRLVRMWDVVKAWLKGEKKNPAG